MTAIDLSTLLWLGPATQKGVVEDLGKYFFKATATQADVFVNLDGEEKMQMSVRMGNNRGLKLPLQRHGPLK